ncbi:uncharacterized protein LAESUDRAFT_810804 [Laetiporus sulphureus 93-53]|uniref:F-box domain-containing protein n=1 Tax=Laetiporus sulphureus 93-53 TaxID=1314785 RepID=A0A165FLQ1_9APHY|nr:uncharacterized protein LAESUDRAFT_810804 [Laetiporus sulphureus 93-53]KZT09158.1 hypothetical protein LAESUDRAFT_810804 [Laetiporus sulphureus 93-53]
MHRALLLNELLLQILQVLREDDIHALAVLARTRRSFSQPALEILWESLDDPSPIIKLFPDDSWTVAYDPYNRKLCIEFIRLLRPVDWVTPLKYLPLIKRLGLENASPWAYTSSYMSSQALQYLSIFRPVLAILPNLRVLNLNLTSYVAAANQAKYFQYSWAFLGPELRSFTFRSVTPSLEIEEQKSLARLLYALEHACPLLEEIRSSCGCPPGRIISDAFSSLVSRLENLRVLECFDMPLNARMKSALGKKKTLYHFHLSLLRQEHSRHVWDSSWFQSLETMKIRTDDPQSYVSFANSVSLSRVHSFILQIRTPLTQGLMQQLFSSIHRQLSDSPLSTFELSYEVAAVEVSNDPLVILLSQHLQELLIFRHLEAVEISGPWCIQINDNILRQMAFAWPNLRRLYVYHNDWCISKDQELHPHATLQGIVGFAQNCLQLHSLIVELHADGSMLPEIVLPQPSRCPLQDFTVCCSTISSKTEVAAFLSRLFPSLTSIDASDRYGEPEDSQWMKDWSDVDRAVRITQMI